MSNEQLKLTDEVLDEMFHNLCGQHERCERMVAAVRALRSAAEAVVKGHRDFYALSESMNALRDLLPETTT